MFKSTLRLKSDILKSSNHFKQILNFMLQILEYNNFLLIICIVNLKNWVYFHVFLAFPTLYFDKTGEN